MRCAGGHDSKKATRVQSKSSVSPAPIIIVNSTSAARVAIAALAFEPVGLAPLLLPVPLPCAAPGVWLAFALVPADDTEAGTETAETAVHAAFAFVPASSCV